MRIVFALLLIAFFQNAEAQDFCSLVKKDVSPDKTLYSYSSPFDPSYPPTVRITRSYNTDPDYATDDFFIIFQLTGSLESIYVKTDTSEDEKEERKLEVVFDDSSKLVDDTIAVSHDFTPDRTQSIRYVFLSLTEPTIKDFSSKKIARFSLAGYEQPVNADSANAIMHYMQCIKSVK